jgi:hypothetical protein
LAHGGVHNLMAFQIGRPALCAAVAIVFFDETD